MTEFGRFKLDARMQLATCVRVEHLGAWLAEDAEMPLLFWALAATPDEALSELRAALAARSEWLAVFA